MSRSGLFERGFAAPTFAPRWAAVAALLAAGALTACGSDRIDYESSKAEQPAAVARPGTLDCETDQTIDYNAMWPNVPGGPQTPEAALVELRQSRNFRVPDRPARSYYRGPNGESQNATAQKIHEFKTEAGKTQLVVTTERIGDSWHPTGYSACASVIEPVPGLDADR